MAQYSYTARNNSGDPVTGSLEAESEQAVVVLLRQRQLTPVKISPGGRSRTVSRPDSPVVRVRPVPVSELVVFCVNFSSMISAGVPLLGALMVIADQLENPYFGEVVRNIRKDVSEGGSFSDALEKYPKVFSKFFVNMLRVGEVSGTMESVLKSLVTHLERQEEVRQKISGALVYPMILVFAGSAVILLIITFVMPQFVKVF